VFAYSTIPYHLEVEDTLAAVLQYPNGSLATIEATTATRPVNLEGSITILGTNGTVKVGGFAANKMELWKFEEPMKGDDLIEKEMEVPPDVYGYGHRSFYYHVLDCLQKNKETPINGRDSLRVVTAIYQSIELRQEIALHVAEPVSRRLGRDRDSGFEEAVSINPD
jgi:predicted dehydrogenase